VLRALSHSEDAERRAQRRPIAPPAVTTASRAVRILLAEDNEVNQRLARVILEKAGHAVVTADTGEEAVAAWQTQRFDVILMDVEMPVMDGFAATSAIRSRETADDRVPIIAMTAHAMSGDRERCLAAGMDAYLTKPIRAADLLAMVREWTVDEIAR